jgi:hypothetical protein
MADLAIKGYVAGTGDKYARYFDAEEYAEYVSQTTGKLVGIASRASWIRIRASSKSWIFIRIPPRRKRSYGKRPYPDGGREDVGKIGYEPPPAKSRTKGRVVILGISRRRKNWRFPSQGTSW